MLLVLSESVACLCYLDSIDIHTYHSMEVISKYGHTWDANWLIPYKRGKKQVLRTLVTSFQVSCVWFADCQITVGPSNSTLTFSFRRPMGMCFSEDISIILRTPCAGGQLLDASVEHRK